MGKNERRRRKGWEAVGTSVDGVKMSHNGYIFAWKILHSFTHNFAIYDAPWRRNCLVTILVLITTSLSTWTMLSRILPPDFITDFNGFFNGILLRTITEVYFLKCFFRFLRFLPFVLFVCEAVVSSMKHILIRLDNFDSQRGFTTCLASLERWFNTPWKYFQDFLRTITISRLSQWHTSQAAMP